MRILLALITVFSVFQAQAYCLIKGVDIQSNFTAKEIPIDLNAGDQEITQPISLPSNSINTFICEDTSPQLNKFTLIAGQGNAEYYLIEQEKHKLYVKISLEQDSSFDSGIFPPDKTIDHHANELNNLKYKLKYSVQSNYTGNLAGTITANTSKKLNNYIMIKPAECAANQCSIGSNINQKYTYYVTIRPTFTPTTCTFKNQTITVASISYQDIDTNSFVVPNPQPSLQCSSSTGVATSNITYRFQSITPPSHGVLVNELGINSGSAGEVGFELKNKDKAITFAPDQKFTIADFGNVVENNKIIPLDLKVRYARYGDHVVTGRVQSKVKVVVDYD